MKRRAMTLLEVMFVTGLLGLFTVMVSRALVMGFRAHRKTMERTAAQRQGSVAMSIILREIAVCFDWNVPAVGSGLQHPTAQGQLNWRRNTRDTGTSFTLPTELVEYWLDVDSQELRKTNPQAPAGFEVVARSVTDFSVDVRTDKIVVTLQTKDNGVPLVVVGHPIRM